MTEHDIDYQVGQMQGEINAIDTRIERALEAIKADVARRRWLREQIMLEAHPEEEPK